MRAYNFGVRGSNLTKLLQVTCREAGMITWVQFLRGLPPLKPGRAKTVQNLVRFRASSHFDREYLRNGWRYRQADNGVINHNPSHVRRKKFGKLWSTNNKDLDVHFDPPKSTYSEDHISVPMGRWRLKFLHTLENYHGFLAHIPMGAGVPATIFNNEHSKICLKFGVRAPITLGLGGATSPNVSRSRAARQAW